MGSPSARRLRQEARWRSTSYGATCRKGFASVDYRKVGRHSAHSGTITSSYAHCISLALLNPRDSSSRCCPGLAVESAELRSARSPRLLVVLIFAWALIAMVNVADPASDSFRRDANATIRRGSRLANQDRGLGHAGDRDRRSSDLSPPCKSCATSSSSTLRRC